MAAVALRLFYGEKDDEVQSLKERQPHLFDLARSQGLSPDQIRALSLALNAANPLPTLNRELLQGVLRQPTLLQEFERCGKDERSRMDARIGAGLPCRALLAAALRTARLQGTHPGR